MSSGAQVQTPEANAPRARAVERAAARLTAHRPRVLHEPWRAPRERELCAEVEVASDRAAVAARAGGGTDDVQLGREAHAANRVDDPLGASGDQQQQQRDRALSHAAEQQCHATTHGYHSRMLVRLSARDEAGCGET